MLISTFPCSIRIVTDTVGANIGIQLVAGSSFAPDKKKSFPVCDLFSRAFKLQGLMVNPECKGFFLPINGGKINSFFTISSRMPARDNLRH